jgi:hypothetical protein
MKKAIAIGILLALCGCGVSETATVAATGAALKEQEARQAQRTLQQVEGRLDKTTQQLQARGIDE